LTVRYKVNGHYLAGSKFKIPQKRNNVNTFGDIPK